MFLNISFFKKILQDVPEFNVKLKHDDSVDRKYHEKKQTKNLFHVVIKL